MQNYAKTFGITRFAGQYLVRVSARILYTDEKALIDSYEHYGLIYDLGKPKEAAEIEGRITCENYVVFELAFKDEFVFKKFRADLKLAIYNNKIKQLQNKIDYESQIFHREDHTL